MTATEARRSAPAARSAPSLAPFHPVVVDDLVRVGRDHDGGYVISRRAVDAAQVLVGLGINVDWSFETDFLARNPRARVVGVDGSVSAAVFRRIALWRTVKAALSLVPRLRPDIARAHRRVAREHVRLAAEFARFWRGERRFLKKFILEEPGPNALRWADLRRELGSAGGAPPALFVKMDIEGAEYDVLPQVLRDAEHVAGLAVEFHDCGERWEELRALMARLDEAFVVVHTHGNNCTGLVPGTAMPETLEVSFLHRRLLRAGEGAPSERAYPLPGLDQPNEPRFADFPLAF